MAVRTFACGNRGRHQRDGFDLCTLTHCQVLREPYAAVRDAAAATDGQVLLANGAPASVFYTASCGGRTERPSAVWPGADDPPYLPSKADRACGGEPRWAAEIPVQDLERTLTAAGYRGSRLRGLEVDGRSASGRVARVHLDGMTPDAISGQDLRMIVGRTLGWHLLKSTDFTVRRTGGGYRFDGKGFGHGVGLCVLGSVRRAEHGDSAREILHAYFPGLEIGRAPAPRPRPAAPSVRLPHPAHPTAPATPRQPATASARMPPSVHPEPPFTLPLPPSAEPDRAAVDGLRAARSPTSRVRPDGRRPPVCVWSFIRRPTASGGKPASRGGRRRARAAPGSICCRRPFFASAASSSPRCGTNWRTCLTDRRSTDGPSG